MSRNIIGSIKSREKKSPVRFPRIITVNTSLLLSRKEEREGGRETERDREGGREREREGGGDWGEITRN